MLYDFDLYEKLKSLLPETLQKPKMIAFLQTLFKPLETLKTNFLGFFEEARRLAHLNGQATTMQTILNDLYDPTLRRIRIADTDTYFYAFTLYPEEPQKYLSEITDVFIYDDYSDTYDTDFVVFTFYGSPNPEDTIEQIRFFVAKYTIAGKTFAIINF
ncbi:MAG: hypothetical protein SFU27_06580 [Thermonemataceae bacterium]|nr:hypothetical protein [Thermonemataceae bacterium]